MQSEFFTELGTLGSGNSLMNGCLSSCLVSNKARMSEIGWAGVEGLRWNTPTAQHLVSLAKIVVRSYGECGSAFAQVESGADLNHFIPPFAANDSKSHLYRMPDARTISIECTLEVRVRSLCQDLRKVKRYCCDVGGSRPEKLGETHNQLTAQ
eukprot:74777-Amphidinium_carterae.1